MKRWFGSLCALALLAGCATALKVPELEPGKSTAKDAEAQLGKPALELKRPDGGKVLYFTTFPFGRNTYAVMLGADGVVRSVDQRLTENNLNSVKEGMTKDQVLERLGPPRQETREERQERIVLEYPWIQGNREMRLRYMKLSYDGIVREIFDQHDQEAQPENH